MKLPVQAAAVLREGHSRPARRPSAQGLSPSHSPRTDVNICQYDANNPKCGDGYQIYNCATAGTCQCCPVGKGVTEQAGGQCTCNN